MEYQALNNECLKLRQIHIGKVEEKMSGESFSDDFTKSFSANKNQKAITFLRDGKVETEIS